MLGRGPGECYIGLVRAWGAGVIELGLYEERNLKKKKNHLLGSLPDSVRHLVYHLLQSDLHFPPCAWLESV